MEIKDYTRFSCCAFWQKCDLGRGQCFFEKTEPNKKHFCGAFLNRDYREELQVVNEHSNEEPVTTEAIIPNVPAATQNADSELLLVFDEKETPLSSEQKPDNQQGFIEETGQFTLF